MNATPSRAYARYVLTVLFVVYVFNFIDRQVLAMVIEDVKAEMQLSDTMLGLLLGPAFTLFYTLAGIPIARLADRSNRRNIVAAGLAVWSAMTAVCGLAGNALHLALARFGVGIGEAAGTPPSHSMISDYFPPERRATALSIYGMGIYLGVMFGFMGGGLIRDWSGDWRTPFYVLGAAGLPLVALLLFTVREPARGAAEHGAVDTETPPLREVLRTLGTQRSFVLLTLAACFQALAGYAVLSWGAAFLMRVHALDFSQVGVSFGLVAGVGGAVGVSVGGVLSDRLGARDARWYVWLPAIVSVVAAPFALPFYLASDVTLALGFFAIYYTINNMYVGALWSVAQGLVKVRMRALASATLLTVLNIVGMGLGPFLVGFLNETAFAWAGDEAIRYSLLVTAGIGAIAAVFFVLCGRGLREDLARAAGSGEAQG